MISVKNLIKSYKSGDGELVVLNGINLDVNSGEFLAVTGRSGSGKSTLLYQLGLLDHPNSGTITIDGRDVSKLTASQRTEFRLKKLGYVFQDYALIPELTTLENVLIPLYMQGIDKSVAMSKAMNSLERLELQDKINNLPSQLSGGQQQRVSIARAIAHDPVIIFADEPTANLDSETSESVMRSFKDLHSKGQTIVMVTHEPEYVAYAERSITLLDGKIVNQT